MVGKSEGDKIIQLNVAITNGNFVLASRYVSDQSQQPNTLYYSEGSRFECVNGVCQMRKSDREQHAVLIVSEKLTDSKDDWHAVPVNHFVIVREDLSVAIEAIL